MLCLLAFVAAAYAHPEQLVDTEWVVAHATDPNVRIVDMRQNGYGEGHVPGAVYLSPVAIRDAKAPPMFLPTPAAFEAMMAGLGVGDGDTRHRVRRTRRDLRCTTLVDPQLLRSHERGVDERRLDQVDSRASAHDGEHPVTSRGAFHCATAATTGGHGERCRPGDQ